MIFVVKKNIRWHVFLLCLLPVFEASAEESLSQAGVESNPRRAFTDAVGEIPDDVLPPAPRFELVPGKSADSWQFVIEPYGWTMGLDGEIGVKGMPPSAITMNARSILQHLDWGIFVRGEVRKGRWGVLADGYYAALSASGTPDNRIYDNVDTSVQQSIVSLALACRLIDDRCGFLDLYAGARYNFLGAQSEASLNSLRVEQIGTNAANTLTQRIDAGLDAQIQNLVAGASGQATTVEDLVRAVGGRALRRTILGDRDLRRLDRSGLLRKNLQSSGVQDALRDYVRASAQAKAAAAQGIIDSSLQTAVANSKARLAREISNRIEEVVPTYGAGSQWWFDPIVGLRGQINFTRWLFLAAQGDVGGFGAGAQIAWNAQASLGFNFTRNVFAEIGYRYMYVDYANGGFLYNMNSFGLYSGVGVKF